MKSAFMKKVAACILFVAVALVLLLAGQPGVNASLANQAVFFVDQQTYVSNGETKVMDGTPFVEQGRSFVPVRYLAYSLGLLDSDIKWDGESKTVTLSHQGSPVAMTLGSKILQVGDRQVAMDAAPQLREGRVYLPARWVAEALGYQVEWVENSKVLVGPPGKLPDPGVALGNHLPLVGTNENMEKLLSSAQGRLGGGYMMREGLVAMDNMKSAAPAMESTQAADGAGASSPPSAANEYSKTNTQVAGVDEGDIVKTDGNYIYHVNNRRVVISKAYPATEMSIVKTLDFSESTFNPRELYVDEKHLVVVGEFQNSREYPPVRPMPEISGTDKRMIMPPYFQSVMTRALVYDIADKGNIRKVRELDLDGNYLSSRKIGDSFYLLANQGIYYFIQGGQGYPKPAFRDTAVKAGLEEVDFSQIRYFPDFVNPNYLMVAALDLGKPQGKANISTYLGSGENVYASTENLYVGVTGYGSADDAGTNSKLRIMPRPDNNTHTKIYKFALKGGDLAYSASGEVPGTVLNQFSMDEYGGNFRVATTRGDMWRNDEYTSKNNVYVLNRDMKLTGKLEDIAPGEKIYSVRFVGDRGYMVTFKTVDPFFVIDLKDPASPQILGALKIPGYSDYLQPYDENHIIGFGKDTVELSMKGGAGDEANTMAFYTGMKMAIFDVTDVANPKQMFVEKIGDRGTDSELLRNHRALLFSREKGLLAFPVTVMQVEDSLMKPGSGFPEYGQFKFQGAYVYGIDLQKGFSLKGKISHLSEQDYLKAGSNWYDSGKNVERIIYIKDTLYTLSQKYIKANSLNGLGEVKALEIK